MLRYIQSSRKPALPAHDAQLHRYREQPYGYLLGIDHL